MKNEHKKLILLIILYSVPISCIFSQGILVEVSGFYVNRTPPSSVVDTPKSGFNIGAGIMMFSQKRISSYLELEGLYQKTFDRDFNLIPGNQIDGAQFVDSGDNNYSVRQYNVLLSPSVRYDLIVERKPSIYIELLNSFNLYMVERSVIFDNRQSLKTGDNDYSNSFFSWINPGIELGYYLNENVNISLESRFFLHDIDRSQMYGVSMSYMFLK